MTTRQEQFFQDRDRRHVLQITNHGVHEWQVLPGLPDTGGQNVYVNQFTEALVKLGYRVTIVNRGGYPHPVTGEMQAGVKYHPSGHARIVYLNDGHAEFVRKEDMNEYLPRLAADLRRRLHEESDTFDLIISHYWDAGKLGAMINQNGDGAKTAPHVWIPHSLGAIKKRNMDPSTWQNLRIDERISHEQRLLGALDGGVATSTTIRDSFRNDYGWESKYFLPPCVDTDRYRPMKPAEYEPIWPFLSRHGGLSADEIRQRKIITEISRTDKTKRKDILQRFLGWCKPDGACVVIERSTGGRVQEFHQLVSKTLETGFHLYAPCPAIFDKPQGMKCYSCTASNHRSLVRPRFLEYLCKASSHYDYDALDSGNQWCYAVIRRQPGSVAPPLPGERGMFTQLASLFAEGATLPERVNVLVAVAAADPARPGVYKLCDQSCGAEHCFLHVPVNKLAPVFGGGDVLAVQGARMTKEEDADEGTLRFHLHADGKTNIMNLSRNRLEVTWREALEGAGYHA